MKSAPPILTEHRCSRLTAWLRLVLTWLGGVLIGTCDRRTARGWLDKAARSVAHIIVVRAVMHMPHPKRRTLRDFAPAGFKRTTRMGSARRIVRGNLRKLMRHRDPLIRFALIVNALNNIDALAARVRRRARRGLTRIFSIRAIRPPHDTLRVLRVGDVVAQNSS